MSEMVRKTPRQITINLALEGLNAREIPTARTPQKDPLDQDSGDACAACIGLSLLIVVDVCLSG